MKSKTGALCEKHDIPYKIDYEIGKYSYSRTGLKVRIAIFPNTSEKLIYLIQEFKNQNIDFKIIGSTTNILFLESQIYQCFVYTTMLTEYDFHENHAIVGCGRAVSDFVRDVSMRSIEGFEGLEGIPGTIGGALVMNAGAYGYSISDNLLSVDVIDVNGEVRTIWKSEMKIVNRSIPTLQGKIIVRAKFNLKKGTHSQIEKMTRKFHISRHQYQEWVYPNLGSIYIVPGLNINQNMREIHTGRRFFLKYLYFILFKVWFFKPLFIFRRSFPSFNLPFELLKMLKIKTYNSEVASKTTVNTFSNKNYSTLTILEYFLQLREDAGGTIKLENEIYTGNVETVVDPRLRKLQLKIVDQLGCEKSDSYSSGKM
ncbi:FAD-binding protein [Thalassospira sp. HJ]|uniref:FAD-binding protein n=1 Tax=Thalassospira sp. HJ TaxID=1616823 RepID=UPI0006980AD9|nr:FAD-binding protein [Thalassospira sp. HJ]